MKAIQIRYYGPTNTKGSRYKAWTDAGAIITAFNYALDADENARAAAVEYARVKFNRDGIQGFGSLPNGDYVATLGE